MVIRKFRQMLYVVFTERQRQKTLALPLFSRVDRHRAGSESFPKPCFTDISHTETLLR